MKADPSKAFPGLLWLLVSGIVSAQEIPVQVTGRADSSFVNTEDQSAGLLQGWVDVTGGTREVKPEVRVGLTNQPTPGVTLDRAWTKFRFPGLRFTGGLGRISWGPGFVLDAGDLLFDSTSTAVNFENDELRDTSALLGDGWASLGDEAFAEGMVLQDTLGARVSAAPGGVTLEAATAWDRNAGTLKTALSTQFNFLADWYFTVRQDVVTHDPVFGWSGTLAGAGVFELWPLGNGLTLASRHEFLVSGADPRGRLKAYEDLSLALDSGWTFVDRSLYDAAGTGWTDDIEVHWSPLQALELYALTTLTTPWACQVGCTGKF